MPTSETNETVSPSSPETSQGNETKTAVLNAILSQLQWLDILINTLEPTVSIDPYSPWLEVDSYNGNVRCGAFLHAFNEVKAAPIIDVQNSELDVQNAYNVYRAGLDSAISNNDLLGWEIACQTAIQEGQDNLEPSNFQRGLLRLPLDEARNLLNQARSIVEEQ